MVDRQNFRNRKLVVREYVHVLWIIIIYITQFSKYYRLHYIIDDLILNKINKFEGWVGTGSTYFVFIFIHTILI